MAKSLPSSKRTKPSASIKKGIENTMASATTSTKQIKTKQTTVDKKEKKEDIPKADIGLSKKDQKNQQLKESRIVTMQALQEMSDDDNDDEGELPPESEWSKEALALKAAIEAGTFDAAVLQNVNDNDESSFEEVDLESDDEDEDEDDEGVEESGEQNDLEVDDDDDDDDDDGDGEEEEEEEEIDNDGDEEEEEEEDLDINNESAIEEQMVENAVEKDDDEIDNGDEEEDEEEDNEEDDDENRELIESNATRAKALQVVTASLLAEKKNWDWSETFDIVPPTPLPFNKEAIKAIGGVSATTNPLGIHDDLQREVAFYDVALEAVLEAKVLCNKAGIPFTRPDDFFAEMVKTDDHMAKVKDRLIFESKKIEAVAQRKSNKEQKLRAKETQANKLAEKAKKKRDHMQEVSDWAESAKASRGGNDTSIPTNKKRAYSDSKFGHGGKRGRFKQNDPQSMNDMSSFNKKKGTFTNTPRTKQGKKSGAGANRPGKRSRDASRSKSR